LNVSDQASGHDVDPRPTGTVGLGRLTVFDRFEDLYTSRQRNVLSYLMRLGIGNSAAQDVAQDAFCAVLLNWDRIKNVTRPDLYLYKVARNCAFDYIRSSAREAPLPDPATEELVTDDLGADETAQRVQETDIIRRALKHLPPAQRHVLALHIDDCSSGEIAQYLDMDAATVRSNLRYARMRLRAVLTADDF
jgi:RNA polymerase sigma factor (sigma-70 family)